MGSLVSPYPTLGDYFVMDASYSFFFCGIVFSLDSIKIDVIEENKHDK